MAVAALQDVRDVLAAYPGLVDAAVLTYEQDPVGQVHVAYVVPGGAGFDLAALHQHLRGALPGTAVPAAVVVVDALPVASGGTPQAHVLPVVELRGLGPYRAPGSDRQELLCTIFAEVLARPRWGLDDDFFVMGGESIDAMLIASRVGPAVGVEISINEIFDAPTVAELDRLLDTLSTEV
ncbi:phosphopantetheine-binding protein [Streptomyces sp. NBC_00887]|uniref:phosphopantetheine-binding protein n=1 Tax=Streptomyces sp. NBC_00887 TaxID=2975859 RepID=UPI00386ECD5E|nr:phosphopantetheine-binding protein [Streptomyces sp. NBC_00887]WSY36948.1 phosphopantetheine-binding protein [Streptomyces sp. NBC_00887]